MLLVAALALLLVVAGIYLFSAGDETAAVVQVPVSPAVAPGSEPPPTPPEHVDSAVAGVSASDPAPLATVPAGEMSPQAENTPQTAPPAVAARKQEPRTRPRETAQRNAPPAAELALPKGGAGARSWLVALQADLAVCERESFFPRIACREKARWKHCAPDHWNAVPECKASAGGEHPGQNP